MTAVRLYTARSCPYCARAKKLLARRGLSFTEIDISGNWELRDEMIGLAAGQTAVPQTFIGSKHVGGVAQLEELDRHGELESLLNAVP